MVKWAVELNEFPISFAPRTTTTERAFFEFIVKSMSIDAEEATPITKALNKEELSKIRTDGSSSKESSWQV